LVEARRAAGLRRRDEQKPSAAGTTVTAMKVRVHRAYNVIRKTYDGRFPQASACELD
jgi:hypothetical protein